MAFFSGIIFVYLLFMQFIIYGLIMLETKTRDFCWSGAFTIHNNETIVKTVKLMDGEEEGVTNTSLSCLCGYHFSRGDSGVPCALSCGVNLRREPCGSHCAGCTSRSILLFLFVISGD
jgi:hypothetical protein